MASDGKNTGLQIGGLALGAVGAILVGKGVVAGEGGWWDIQAYLGYALDVGCVALAAMGGAASARALHAVGGALFALGAMPVGIMLATPESDVPLGFLGLGAVGLIGGIGLVLSGDKLKK